MDIITSTQNKTVKLARSLAEKKFREHAGLFLVEGVNIVKDLPADAEVEFVLVAEGRQAESAELLACTRAQVYYVSEAVMKSLSDTVTPYGFAAAVRIPRREFALPAGNALILDGVSDPGNLGTIIRTAAATGFDDVYLLDCADPYAPKTVRASMGGVFRVRLFKVDEQQAVEVAGNRNSVALDMAGEYITDSRPVQPVVYIAGSEAHGIRKSLLDAAKRVIALPMKNGMESLNVAVATAVAIYQTFIK